MNPDVPLTAETAAVVETTAKDDTHEDHAAHDRKRWIAFSILGLGTLMNVLDTTIANIALQPIQKDLHFTDAGLAWVVNAYMLTFGGFLLLGGRLGDLYGPRRLFLIGLTIFTLASLGCGIATTQTMLIAARAIQGIGAALVAAVSLSIIMNLFQDGPGRAKAMGIFAFIASGGGALGALLGGFITKHYPWHYNFLINIPIGIAVFIGTLATVPALRGNSKGRLDLAGAFTLTASLLLAVYAVVGAAQAGWTSTATLQRLGGAAALMGLFILIERGANNPLVPLGMFRSRNIVGTNIIGVLWAAAMFAWFFLSAQYMQKVLILKPDVVGYAFLPANVVMALFSIGISAKLVHRFGIRLPMATGLLLAAAGLLWFYRAPVDGSVWIDVAPGMVLLGIGAGMAFNPLFLAAMSDAKPEESGLASGLVNTSFMMGGALGLAVLASLAASTTAMHDPAHPPGIAALNLGYHAAFLAAACACAIGAIIAAAVVRVKHSAPGQGPAPAMH